MKHTHEISSTVNLSTKSNHSASTNVLLVSFYTAQATGFFTRKFCARKADVNNYHDKNMFRYERVTSTGKLNIVAEIAFC